METLTEAESLVDLAGHLRDIVWQISPDSQILFTNQYWKTFAGANRLEASDRLRFPPTDFIHKDDTPRLTALWLEALKNGGEFDLEVRILRPTDGKYLWHKMRVYPVPDKIAPASLPASSQWIAASTDVHQLKTVQAMFQLVMDNIPISIFWKDRQSVYLGCNKSFAADVGQENAEAIIGKTDYDQPSSKEQSDFFIQCDKRVMDSDVAEYRILEPQLRANGEQAWLETTKIPLHDAAGQVIGVLGLYEDITERVTLAQQREDFVATLTHDLKNPLLGTNRVLDMLTGGTMGELSPGQLDVLNQIKDSNTVLVEMIQDLLDVYRQEAGFNNLKIDRIDIHRLLESAVSHNQIAAQSKSISLQLDVPDGQAIAEACLQSLSRVIQNLLDNALKFTPPHGFINVQLRDGGTTWQIEVSDSGPGIAIDEQKQLFGRFWQGEPGKKYAHGSGLGLYLCKQIVEAHGGQITCRSTVGEGASFMLFIPKESPKQSQEQSRSN